MTEIFHWGSKPDLDAKSDQREEKENQEELSGTILVADDEEGPRTGIAVYVMLAGCTAVEVENGQQVLAKLESGEKFTVLILDIDMPGMTGIEVLENIRHNPKFDTQPVLINSGRPSPERETLIRELKGAFISKPYDFKEFEEAVKRAIELAKR